MTDSATGPDPRYRPSAGVMLLNRDGRVFVARRIDTAEEAWQMPQGGIDPGESPRDAALRELHEEIGTASAEIIAESRRWLSYDFPAGLGERLWQGRYIGQCQKWFAMRFTGADADIDLETAHPEFNAWQWVDVDDIPALIVAFKRAIYEQVVAEFRHLAKPASPGRG